MELLKLEKVHFQYPHASSAALQGLDLSVQSGQFVVLFGPSGCGKTTLLRNLKREIAPHGQLGGRLLYRGKPLAKAENLPSPAEIGFVMQDPDQQIVTDTVWHELAFGLENIGMKTTQIRRKVAETAHFFGITSWFDRSTLSLSGGQKQILNLAAILAMQPSLILLDEPVSQLDPIAAKEFLSVLQRVHQELGVTVMLSEHLLEDVFPMADKAVYMDQGKIEFCGLPREFVTTAIAKDHPYVQALPGAVRIARRLGEKDAVPLTVNEGRSWLKNKLQGQPPKVARRREFSPAGETLLAARNLWYRYSPRDDFVLKGLSCDVKAGQILSMVGGNGSGKSTALSLLAKAMRPQRGKVRLAVKSKRGGDAIVAMLPQSPQALFIEDTVQEDLHDAARRCGRDEKAALNLARQMGLEGLLKRHPFDLSGGEQQKAALAKLFLQKPRVMLLDEPTKGLDFRAKEELAIILQSHCRLGGAVVIVTHDVEFAAQHSDSCAMLFAGELTALDDAQAFFAGNTFYTTAANRMSRGLIRQAVTCEDVIEACQDE